MKKVVILAFLLFFSSSTLLAGENRYVTAEKLSPYDVKDLVIQVLTRRGCTNINVKGIHQPQPSVARVFVTFVKGKRRGKECFKLVRLNSGRWFYEDGYLFLRR